MGWADAIAAVGTVIGKVMDRLWGEQTKEEANEEHEADTLGKQLEQAYTEGNVDAVNDLHTRLVQLRNKAIARRAGQATMPRGKDGGS